MYKSHNLFVSTTFSDGWENYHTVQLPRSGSELVKILRFETLVKSSYSADVYETYHMVCER